MAPQKQYNSFGINISIIDGQYDHNFKLVLNENFVS